MDTQVEDKELEKLINNLSHTIQGETDPSLKDFMIDKAIAFFNQLKNEERYT